MKQLRTQKKSARQRPTQEGVEGNTLFDIMLQDPSGMSQMGAAIQVQAQQAAAQAAMNAAIGQTHPYAFKETTLATVGTNIYGRYSIFDPCSAGDIIGLQVETNGLMQWLGFRPNRFYRRRVDFIAWWGPQGTSAGNPVSFAGAPCDNPNGWEYGKAGYELLHTSWYHAGGDALGPHQVVQDRCETTPRYRLNGRLITDDVEWQMQGSMNALQQNLRRDLIHGNHDNAYEMDGLSSIIRGGYAIDGHLTPQVDSIIVPWNNDGLDGEVNGYGNFFDYLDEIVTEIEWRSSALGVIADNNMAIFTSRFMGTCLLDKYACYTTCGVTDIGDISDQGLRAQQRASRMSLNAGPLYDGTTAIGYLPLKSGRRLPILVEDNVDIHRGGVNKYCTDIWILTRRIGAQDVLYGEYLDLRVYENRVKQHAPGFTVRADAAGRFAFKSKEDNWCVQLIVGTSPELYLSAPWAQVRITDVCCTRRRQPMTGDPYQPQYLPGGGHLYPAYSV